jgi:hypothetical protein
MTDVEVWGIALSAIAAFASVGSVAFWLYEQGKRRRERPIVALHVQVEPRWGNPPPTPGRVELTLTITSVGDATPRHLEVEGDGGFRLDHHHEEAGLAALPPGAVLRLPVSWPTTQASVNGQVLWVEGPGKKITVGSIEFTVSAPHSHDGP